MIHLGDDVTIFHIWAVAAVLLGFQMAALAWRLNRELYKGEQKEITWIPWADRIIFASMLTLIGGVFIAPLLGNTSLEWAAWLFGLALVLFALTPVVIAGHYDLFRHNPNRNVQLPRTIQESWALGIVFVAIAGYFVASPILLI